MPKVDPDILKDFGRAVKRARAKLGIGQAELGAMVKPPVGNSLISKIEKGQKGALDVVTVGRFRNALDLDESWLDKFLDAEETEDGGETKAEREADQVVDRLRREGATEGATDDLLIRLANNFTEGDHKDRDTAYRSVKAALETLKVSEDIVRLAGNTDAQFAALMRQIDDLNNDGEFDKAARLLDEEGDRIGTLMEFHLQKQLNQDRLRNLPERASERLVADIRRQAPAGGVFWAVDRLASEWNNTGHGAGDLFALQVALELAKINYAKAKGKKRLEASSLYTLGWGHLRLALRSSKDGHLKVAKNAFEAAIRLTSVVKEPENWSMRQDGFAQTLTEIGERGRDPTLLQEAVTANRAALNIHLDQPGEGLRYRWNTLGVSLTKLGELTQSAKTLIEAEEALLMALTLEDQSTDPLLWEAPQANLALARRYLGEVTEALAVLDQARAGYEACENLNFKDESKFGWATLQWNIADLALARFGLDPDPKHLVEARAYLAEARTFFVEGSEYQTQRCDDLLAQIDAAEAA